MNKEITKKVKRLRYKKLEVLEISGLEWKNFGFKSYKSLSYPDFDICKQTTGQLYDLIIAEQVFEHIEDPDAAATNILSMLKPGGMLLVTTPFLIKYHPSPLDLWRWTKDGMKVFLKKRGFDEVQTFSWGNKDCVVENLEDWPYYNKKIHNLENDKDYPVVVWGYAFKNR